MEPDRRRTVAQRAGDAAETLVSERLRGTGWTILGRNLRLGRNEIDLVAVDPGPPATLVIVEVRWRSRRDFGLPEETLDRRKRAHLRAAVGRLLDAGALPDGRSLPNAPVRVDLIVVEPPLRVAGELRVRHHRNALGG
jgi:Holliday junction resolvase-like predicted endonuclease